MTSAWLKRNRRVLVMAMVPAVIAVICGAALAAADSAPAATRVGGWLLVAGGILLTSALVIRFFQPRIGYADGRLLVHLGGAPTAVPIEVVECFFLGHAETTLPGNAELNAKVAAVVVRLAESAVDWKSRKVKPSLGKWQDGYILVRGTWCEPISGEVVNSLNERLRQAHCQQRAKHCESSRA